MTRFSHEINRFRQFIDDFEEFCQRDEVQIIDGLHKQIEMYRKREDLFYKREIEELELKVAQQGKRIGELLKELDGKIQPRN